MGRRAFSTNTAGGSGNERPEMDIIILDCFSSCNGSLDPFSPVFSEADAVLLAEAVLYENQGLVVLFLANNARSLLGEKLNIMIKNKYFYFAIRKKCGHAQLVHLQMKMVFTIVPFA